MFCGCITLFIIAGLRKAKEYDWKDSNMALFGSDVEKNIKSIELVEYVFYDCMT